MAAPAPATGSRLPPPSASRPSSWATSPASTERRAPGRAGGQRRRRDRRRDRRPAAAPRRTLEVAPGRAGAAGAERVPIQLAPTATRMHYSGPAAHASARPRHGPAGARRAPRSSASSWSPASRAVVPPVLGEPRGRAPRAGHQLRRRAGDATAAITGYSSSSSSIRRSARRRALGSAPERHSASAASSSAATGSATVCSGFAAFRCTPLRSNALDASSTNLSARDCVIGASSSASASEVGLQKRIRLTALQLRNPAHLGW